MNTIRHWISLCETGYDLRQWLTGGCFEFALALAERLPNAEFIGVGNQNYPDHVALRQHDSYYDARGKMDENEFLTKMRGNNPYSANEIHAVSRDAVELHAGLTGMKPPYRGNRDMMLARRAVNTIFPTGDNK